MANADGLHTLLSFCGKKQLKETITPHKLALLVMTKEYCSIVARLRSGKETLGSDNAEEYSKRQMRSFALNLLKFMQIPDIELKELAGCIKETMTARFCNTFETKLQELYNQSVAGIMEYIQALEVLMIDPDLPVPVVHKSSVIGLFLRRMILAFDKMTFSQVTKLYRNYKTYYESGNLHTIDSDSLCSLEIAKACNSDDSKGLEDSKLWKGFASHKQSELFIAQQAALIQTNEREALPPVQLQKHIFDVLKANPDLAEAHYLSYLNSLRVKEYCGAIHHLYHSFDRNMLINQDSKQAHNPDDSNRSFRYAALNLAALHCRFGHKEEALAALREAITRAQETNDNVCLQHALSWLYRLEKDRRDLLLERSIAKTGDLNLSYLTSLGVQAFTQHKALLSAQPSQVFEFMMKSDILNCQHSMLELMANSYAQKAALWHLYGKSCSSNLCSQLLLHLNTSDPARKGLYHSGEGVCLALCNVAMMLSKEGEYDSAMDVINFAKERFPTYSQHSHIWMLTEEIITFDRALFEGNWQVAEIAVNNMMVIKPKESAIRSVQLQLHRGDFAKASQSLYKVLDELKDETTDPEYHVRILLLQTELHVGALNYTSAIAPLTKALGICQQHYLDYLFSLTTLHLVNVQLLLELPTQAMYNLDQIMVSVFSHGSQFDRARAYFLNAKCTIALKMNDKKAAHLLAVGMLSTAIDGFTKINAKQNIKDSLYLQAHIFHELGNTEERNKCSLQFRLMDQDFSSQSRIHIV